MQLVATTDRAAVGHFLQLTQYIDVAIPRGGASLIRRVTDEAKMPVIKHFDGNCHVYVDATADLAMALDITINAKCQRMGVCNACESLLVHAQMAEQLPAADRRGLAESRCRDTRRPADPAVDPRGGGSYRSGLLRGVPGAPDLRAGGRHAGGGDRSHQPLRLAPYRRDCHAEIWWPPGGLRPRSTVRR